MNAFAFVEKNAGLNSRVHEAELYPLSDRGNQISVVIAGVMAASLDKRKAHNLAAETTDDRLYSFGTKEVKTLSDWGQTRAGASVAYKGLNTIINRHETGADNGSRRLNDFAISMCIRHGLQSVAEFEAWIDFDDDDSDE